MPGPDDSDDDLPADAPTEQFRHPGAESGGAHARPDTDDHDGPGAGPPAAGFSAGPPPPTSRGASGGHRNEGEWTGSHRVATPGRRGVSVGVIVALVGVVVVVAAVILWRFFGEALSSRSDVAAGRCLEGDLPVAVLADPAIAEPLRKAARSFNESADPIGDHCVVVDVKSADSGAVVDGLLGAWPAGLGDKPALWVPGSSISTARLQAAAPGGLINGEPRSMATSPVVLAVDSQLKQALGEQDWAALPGLQSNPAALDELNLPGWGSLRLVLPAGDNSDASYLAAEAVATAAAPAGAPATAGVGAVGGLVAGQPELADRTLDGAMAALLSTDDPAAAPVHAVVTTEQQVIERVTDNADTKDRLAAWLPGGTAAVADFPAVLLGGDWVSSDQKGAASEFERFLSKPEQVEALADAGFRTEPAAAPSSDAVDLGPLPAPVPIGEPGVRATLANTLTAPADGGATTIMLDRSLNLGPVVAALNARIGSLPVTAAVGLTTFDGTSGTTEINLGQLGDDVDGQSRSEVLTSTLSSLGSSGGGAVSFTTLRNVYGEAQADFRPGQDNSVLVITSGPHTDRTLGTQGLQDLIRQSADPARPVAVNVIDVGDDPDRPTWESVAQISGGTYRNVPASDSPEMIAAINATVN